MVKTLARGRLPGRTVRALLAGALLAGCADGSPAGPASGPSVALPVELTRDWTTTSPAEVGVDPEALAAVVAAAAANERFRSLVGVRDGRIFVEAYGGGADRETLHDVRSVTKSVISNLVGIAVGQGRIGLDDTLGEHLPPEVTSITPEERAITVRELLTMTGGWQWDETGGLGDYSTWVRTADHLQFLLDRPLVAAPGTSFTYNSAAVHLLGAVLETALGEPLEDFAARELFGRIGIRTVQWENLPGPYPNGGSGIDLRARDLARLGQLMLQDGMSGFTRILPQGWTGAATGPAFEWRASRGALRDYTYGYLWWYADGEPEPAYLAWGYGGQFIYVVPGLRLVVVATTEWRGVSQDEGAGALERAMLDVLVNGVHAAARGG